jgi:hypothetical protein
MLRITTNRYFEGMWKEVIMVGSEFLIDPFQGKNPFPFRIIPLKKDFNSLQTKINLHFI